MTILFKAHYNLEREAVVLYSRLWMCAVKTECDLIKVTSMEGQIRNQIHTQVTKFGGLAKTRL